MYQHLVNLYHKCIGHLNPQNNGLLVRLQLWGFNDVAVKEQCMLNKG